MVKFSCKTFGVFLYGVICSYRFSFVNGYMISRMLYFSRNLPTLSKLSTLWTYVFLLKYYYLMDLCDVPFFFLRASAFGPPSYFPSPPPHPPLPPSSVLPPLSSPHPHPSPPIFPPTSPPLSCPLLNFH